MTEFPAPVRTPLTDPWWDGLAQGHLLFQRCKTCSHAWLPPRAECPECLGDDWQWQKASGSARLISWVVYHAAYHEWFRDKVPYNVAVVELDEGPRLVSSVLSPGPSRIEQQLQLVIQEEAGVALPRFRCVEA
jgi:uncharacterized OB-fold protein